MNLIHRNFLSVIGPTLLNSLINSALNGIPKLDENTIGVYIDSFLEKYQHQFTNQPKED